MITQYITQIRKPKILVVDDTATNIEILMGALENDYDIRFALSGLQALQRVREDEPPDLILLDIMMPVMDGYEVCRQLKADVTTRDIPIIFLTALDAAEHESEGLALGADDYLTKPINLIIARLRIKNCLERAKLGKELHLALTGTQQGLWEWHLPTGQITLDPRYAQALGYGPSELPSNPVSMETLVHPDDLANFKAAGEAVCAGESMLLSIETRWRDKRNAFVWMQVLGKPEDKTAIHAGTRIIGTFINISARKKDAIALLAEKNRLDTLIRAIPDIVMTLDTSCALSELYLPANMQMLLENPDWQHQPPSAVFPLPLNLAIENAVLGAIEKQSLQISSCEIQYDSGTRYFEASAQNLYDGLRYPTGFMVVIRDVTDYRRAEIQLAEMAFHDPLTHLANRRLLLDKLHEAQLTSLRQQTAFAIIFIDLDRFKPINDEYGHQVGDQLLQEVANRLKKSIRHHDMAARLGGDEFVLLLENLQLPQEAALARVAEFVTHLKTLLAQPYVLDDLTVNCSASMGYQVHSGDALDLDQMIKNADIAMYEEKKQRQ
ncbi:diguanylate cyclase domain-containing protein [Leeia oryzae]|uniref:diguanylate cyclase domain-containing protein n=1 Tax=Leeia oryzae TaxID=356662 RepID=UPI00036AA3E9|nr:diguanylate cyclase [Leeia oryzae]